MRNLLMKPLENEPTVEMVLSENNVGDEDIILIKRVGDKYAKRYTPVTLLPYIKKQKVIHVKSRTLPNGKIYRICTT